MTRQPGDFRRNPSRFLRHGLPESPLLGVLIASTRDEEGISLRESRESVLRDWFRFRRRWLASLVILPVVIFSAITPSATAASTDQRLIRGEVKSGSLPLSGMQVEAYRSGDGSGQVRRLGGARTGPRGRFSLKLTEPTSARSVVYLTAGTQGRIQLAATIGQAPLPGQIVVNELTTVATGYGLAQFIAGYRVAGPSPGPRNAAMMAANLADPMTGRIASTLRTDPNGNRTSTLATFKSVANMLAGCARKASSCSRLFRLTAPPGARPPGGALQAVANIAKHPWQNVGRLASLARERPAPYGGALPPGEDPAAWTMPLRFDGDGRTLDGPGNTAFDDEGNAYVTNNYEYGADPTIPVCGSDLLPVFAPDGSFIEGSPFRGGGLSGAGYGITLDPLGDLWVANFGFAAPAPGCPDDQQPPHNSVSQFRQEGVAVSPDTGWTYGGISWPQGTVSDRRRTIWVANCSSGDVTRMPGDDPEAAVGIETGLEEAFDLVVNGRGQVAVTGLGNSKLAILDNQGTPLPGSPLDSDALGLDRPMGMALDSQGNMWIANSGLIDLPCPDPVDAEITGRGGSLSLLGRDLQPRTSVGNVFKGGGLTIPWGIAVDGNDNVWVANFGKQRVSHFCGVPTKSCRPGAKAGDPISPGGRGYFFDGFVRLTSVQIDPAGNVWVTNNWELVPLQTNPGGKEMVVLVGAAAPLKTPLIGPPVPLFR